MIAVEAISQAHESARCRVGCLVWAMKPSQLVFAVPRFLFVFEATTRVVPCRRGDEQRAQRSFVERALHQGS